MKEINLTQILKNNIDNPNNRDLQTLIEQYATPHDILAAMKDACQQVLELAAENVKIDCLEFPLDTVPTQSCIQVIEDGYNEREYHIYIEKQSILDTINQVK